MTTIEFQVRDAIERPKTEDDTHPGPLERSRLVNRITADRQWDNPAPVCDLFVDREALTKEMSAVIEANVHAATGVSV